MTQTATSQAPKAQPLTTEEVLNALRAIVACLETTWTADIAASWLRRLADSRGCPFRAETLAAMARDLLVADGFICTAADLGAHF